MDLRGVVDIPDENFATNASMQRDPRLGISIGVLLSVLCVVACAFIIIRHRRCSKSANHQHVNGNGANAISTFSNRSPPSNGPLTGATTLIPTTSTQVPNCNLDAHEMQTLIIPSTDIELVSATNGNGAAKNHDIHMNGIVNAGANRHSFSTTNTHSTDDENSDLSRCGLISSTPKSKHKPIENDHLKSASTNFGSHVAANACIDQPYRRIDCDVEAHCGELATNLFSNDANDELMKTALLPPNKSVHSIMYNNMNEIPPTIQRLPNTATTTMGPTPAVVTTAAVPASIKNSKQSSANMSSTSIASILDDSQQCLLPDPNATESSSASTSSGCVPMDRITNNTNCVFDIAPFDHGVATASSVPHPIVENQRYMRSAALV